MVLAALMSAAALASPLAYTNSAGELYVGNARLAAGTGATYQALEIAPDGKSVLAVESGETTRVVLVPVAGGDPRPIDGTEDADAASISPDGRTVVFTTPDGVYSVAVAGGTPKQLAATPNGATDSIPEISPDGKTIAFARDVVDDQGNEVATLEVMSMSGGKPADRAEGVQSALPLGGRISFSPDGKTIAYAGDGESPGIWTVGAATGDPKQLTSGLDSWPVFSADGTTITYSRDSASDDSDANAEEPADPVDDDLFELWTVPAAGGDPSLQHEGDWETLAAKQVAGAASEPSVPVAPKPVVVTVTKLGDRYTVRWTGTAAAWRVKLVVGRKSAGAVVKGSVHQATFTLKRAKGKPVARVTASA
jgi:dipeptidyl aminopeptidase/acylaminoacyl peptidase